MRLVCNTRAGEQEIVGRSRLSSNRRTNYRVSCFMYILWGRIIRVHNKCLFCGRDLVSRSTTCHSNFVQCRNRVSLSYFKEPFAFLLQHKNRQCRDNVGVMWWLGSFIDQSKQIQIMVNKEVSNLVFKCWSKSKRENINNVEWLSAFRFSPCVNYVFQLQLPNKVGPLGTRIYYGLFWITQTPIRSTTTNCKPTTSNASPNSRLRENSTNGYIWYVIHSGKSNCSRLANNSNTLFA